VTVIDLKGLGLSHRKTFRFLKGTSVIDKNFYPETLGILLMINAPRIAPMLWKILKPMLDANTQKKVHIIGSDYQKTLLEHIAPDQLPVEYGGTCSHKDGACIPEVPLAVAKKACSEYKFAYKLTDQLAEVTIAPRSRLDVVKVVSHPKGADINYSFKVDEHDLTFCVEFTPAAEVTKKTKDKDYKAKSVMLLEAEKHNSQRLVDGVLSVHEPGVVRLLWDNGYSRFTAKKLYWGVSEPQELEPLAVAEDMSALKSFGGSTPEGSPLHDARHLHKETDAVVHQRQVVLGLDSA